MQNLVRQHLLRAQDRMKRQADKGRSERMFQVGDMVYLKLQPYVQASLAPRANQKLAFRYFGPYRVLECAGAVANRLELLLSSLVHHVRIFFNNIILIVNRKNKCQIEKITKIDDCRPSKS